MSSTPQFDEVRFKASTVVFKLGYREYDHGLTVREKKLPRGWILSPDKPAITDANDDPEIALFLIGGVRLALYPKAGV